MEQCDPDLPIDLTLLQGEKQLIGALTQSKKKKGEGTRILECLFTSVQPKTTIQQKTVNLAELIKKERRRILQISVEEPGVIYLPIKREDLEWYIQQSPELQLSLLTSATRIDVRSLASPV